MKNKIVISILLVITLLNMGFSAFLWKQNKELQSDVSTISSNLYRLDFDALEKIKSNDADTVQSDDCGTTWMNPC